MSFADRVYISFIEADRYKLFLNGLAITLEVTFFAAILGIIIGLIVALMNLSNFKIGKWRPLAFIATVYLDIFRGTPIVVQLLIWYFSILVSPVYTKTFVAIIAFGVNSGAYVAEIMRAGILAVDGGQAEAGHSLGFSKSRTMLLIILPQAMKNALPPLVNELIVLIKETAVVGYIALADITKVSEGIRGKTADSISLYGIAIIYLIVTMSLSRLLRLLERRLRRSDIR